MSHAPSPVPRNLDHLKQYQVKPGQVLNPKGIRGNGRALALATLDGILATADNKRKLKKSFQERFDKNPALFFLTFIVPLLPKEAKLTLEPGSGGMQWASLLTKFPTNPKDVSTTLEATASEASAAGDASGKPYSEPPSLSIAPRNVPANMAG
jgi:hypothetical protein